MSRIRKYLWLFVAFGAFILACGVTHVMSVLVIWWPLYHLQAALGVVCAAASVYTAIGLGFTTRRLTTRTLTFAQLFINTERQRDKGIRGLSLAESIAKERREAALLLAQANERLTAVMNSTSECVMHMDFGWNILFGNRRTQESLPDARIGATIWDCFPALAGTEAEHHLRRTMADRVETHYENFYQPYNAWYRVSAFPAGEGISLFFREVTEEKRLQEQLASELLLREKRVEALSHMAGGLAHEISNPLAIIHARASDLQRLGAAGKALPEDVEKFCGSILTTSNRAIRILRGLRGFARNAENDPMELADLKTIMEQCVELQQSRFERHEVLLTVTIGNEIPSFECRETQVGQVITNLLNNAFDAIIQSNAKARWITIDAVLKDDFVTIDLTDSGPGIEESIKPRLKDPFFTTKELTLGMGIGLSLSRAIAQDHGGRLVLLEGTPHTTFRLTLPVNSTASLSDEARNAQDTP